MKKVIKTVSVGMIAAMVSGMATFTSVFATDVTTDKFIDGLKYDVRTGTNNEAMVVGYDMITENITIPATITINDVEYSVTAIDTFAFADFENYVNDKLKSVTMPDTITSLGVTEKQVSDDHHRGSAFYGCVALESVTLPKTLTEIPAYTFFACYALKTIELPESLEKIGSMAFAYSALTDVAIPSSVTSIASRAFSGCSDLNSVLFLHNANQEIALGTVSEIGSTTASGAVFKDSTPKIYTLSDDIYSAIQQQNATINAPETKPEEVKKLPAATKVQVSDDNKSAVEDAMTGLSDYNDDAEYSSRFDVVELDGNGKIKINYTFNNKLWSETLPTTVSGKVKLGIILYNIPKDTTVSQPMVFID